MKQFSALFLLSGFIGNNNTLQYCNTIDNTTNPCCYHQELYKVTMFCHTTNRCTYLTIRNISLPVKKSVSKGYLFDAELTNATILELHKNLIIFISTINPYHNFIRYNINENLCVKLTII